MVSQQNLSKTIPEKSIYSSSSPRLSFSFPVPRNPKDREDEGYNSTESEPKRAPNSGEFEFLSGGLTTMIAADELFCEGKLLPFWQMQRSDHRKLNNMSLKSENPEKTEQVENLEASRISSSWFLDDDASPRPPTCTVLWKELLRLRKQRASSLSPPSSSSSSSPSSKTETWSADGGGESNKEKVGVKRVKRVVERTRSVGSIRIRPVFNVAVCTQRKNDVSTLFYSRKGN